MGFLSLAEYASFLDNMATVLKEDGRRLLKADVQEQR